MDDLAVSNIMSYTNDDIVSSEKKQAQEKLARKKRRDETNVFFRSPSAEDFTGQERAPKPFSQSLVTPEEMERTRHRDIMFDSYLRSSPFDVKSSNPLQTSADGYSFADDTNLVAQYKNPDEIEADETFWNDGSHYYAHFKKLFCGDATNTDLKSEFFNYTVDSVIETSFPKNKYDYFLHEWVLLGVNAYCELFTHDELMTMIDTYIVKFFPVDQFENGEEVKQNMLLEWMKYKNGQTKIDIEFIRTLDVSSILSLTVSEFVFKQLRELEIFTTYKHKLAMEICQNVLSRDLYYVLGEHLAMPARHYDVMRVFDRYYTFHDGVSRGKRATIRCSFVMLFFQILGDMMDSTINETVEKIGIDDNYGLWGSYDIYILKEFMSPEDESNYLANTYHAPITEFVKCLLSMFTLYDKQKLIIADGEQALGEELIKHIRNMRQSMEHSPDFGGDISMKTATRAYVSCWTNNGTKENARIQQVSGIRTAIEKRADVMKEMNGELSLQGKIKRIGLPYDQRTVHVLFASMVSVFKKMFARTFMEETNTSFNEAHKWKFDDDQADFIYFFTYTFILEASAAKEKFNLLDLANMDDKKYDAEVKEVTPFIKVAIDLNAKMKEFIEVSGATKENSEQMQTTMKLLDNLNVSNNMYVYGDEKKMFDSLKGMYPEVLRRVERSLRANIPGIFDKDYLERYEVVSLCVFVYTNLRAFTIDFLEGRLEDTDNLMMNEMKELLTMYQTHEMFRGDMDFGSHVFYARENEFIIVMKAYLHNSRAVSDFQMIRLTFTNRRNKEQQDRLVDDEQRLLAE